VLFGPLGFIVGPIAAALFVTAWDLYGVAFADVLPPVPEAPPSIAEFSSDGPLTVPPASERQPRAGEDDRR
jgi:hypothetical protein